MSHRIFAYIQQIFIKYDFFSRPQLAHDHYDKLEKKAGDCVKCGHCDKRCPFHVSQANRMTEIFAYFGR